MIRPIPSVNKKLGRLLSAHAVDIANALVPTMGLLPRWKPTIDLLGDSEDVAEFARSELHVFPSYLALAWMHGDAKFFDLFIGELASLIYDTSLSGPARAELLAQKYQAEREVYVEHLRRYGAADCEPEFLKAFEDIWNIVNEKDRRVLRVLWISDCLYLDIESFLLARAAESGIAIEPMFMTNRIPAQARQEVRALAKEHEFDAVFFSPFSDGFHNIYGKLRAPKVVLSRSFNLEAILEEAMTDTDAMLRVISENFDCPVYVHNSCNIVRRRTLMKRIVALTLTRRARSKGRTRINDWLNVRLKDYDLASFGGFNLIDEMKVLSQVGELELARYFYFDGSHHPGTLGYHLAEKYSDVVYVETFLRSMKLVVCDTESVIWKTIAGKDGVNQLLDHQEILKRLKSKGIILSINSAGDSANMKWDESTLKMDDFICPQINALPKAQNMRTIVEDLNLKPKNICFMGGQEDERKMVAEAFPDMLVLDANSKEVWRRLDLWSQVARDAGDVDRTQAYRERAEREEFTKMSEDLSSNDRFASLDLKVDVHEATSNELKRVTELINRTNQFNTTGLRVTFKQIENWSKSTDTRIYVATAKDKFGQMGIVSALIVRTIDDLDTIEAFVLSCRVFGFGIETAILERVRADSQDRPVSGRIVETQSNLPCRNVYQDHEFNFEDGVWILRHSSPLEIKPWLTVAEM